MFTQQMLDVIESNWERIAARTIADIRNDERTPRMQGLADAELRDWARDILTSLPSWPVSMDEEKLARRYERLGQERFRASIPVYESIRSLHHLKHNLIGFVRGQIFPQSAADLYSQIEFEHRTGLYFDQLMYHVAKGHYKARQDVQLAA